MNLFKLIQTLMNSPFEFYLTKSRFFGVNKPNSDYVLYLDVKIIQVQVIKEDEFLIKKEAQDLLASVYGEMAEQN